MRAAHGLAGGLAILIALTAIGCSIELDAVGPRTPVASIDITPTAVVLEVGQSRLLTAVTKDAQGHVLEGRDIDWSADDANVAVSSSGVVVGQKPGSAVVHASCEGKSFGVAVTVVLGASSSYDLLYRRRWDDERSDISVLSFGTGGAPAVVMAGLASSHPTASPTGERIAFAVAEYDVFSNDGGLVYSIYAVDRDGTSSRRLTHGSGSEDQPAWSPLGDRIAYRHVDSGGRADIWLMNVDGSGARNLTADLPLDVESRSPAWSADGMRIAFASQQIGVDGIASGIWTMRADGSDKRMLTNTLTGYDAWPTWSPDGEHIAFIRQYDLDGDIAIVSANGGAPVRLPLPGRQLTPAWSPDGETIAFAQPGFSVVNVYTVRPDGTQLRLRTLDIAWGGGVEPTWIRKR